MTDIKNRTYKLEIGGTEEVLTISGDEPKKLRIAFSVDISASWISYAEITIYNLNLESESKVIQEYERVKLTAGYEDQSEVLFSGSIITTERMSDKGTRALKLFCRSGGREVLNSIFNKAYQPGAKWKNIIKDCAEEFGYPIQFIGNFDALGSALNGYNADGPARTELTKLQQEADFSWTIDRGVMYLHRTGSFTPGLNRVFTRKNGLLGTPVVTIVGVDVKVVMNAGITRGSQFEIKSEYAEKSFSNNYFVGQAQLAETNIEGKFYAFSINHSGDTHGDEWRTHIIGLRR